MKTTDNPESCTPQHGTNRGRGALENPAGRFEGVEIVYEGDEDPEEALNPRPLKTRFFHDHTRNIVTFNDSPDVGFDASINPYRGCEHGCIYCYARPTHEYLGLSAGLDFESKIFVKTEAPRLLREKLASKSWKPQSIAMSGVTDCYQPAEKRFQLTRQCLEVLAEFRNPAGIITKNHLVTRDIDILRELARFNAVRVLVSITTLDADLARVMEPRTSQPERRLEAVRALSKAGIPVSVMMAPIVPGLTDHEIDAVLKAAAEAGAQSAYHTIVRLPHGVKDLFQTWLAAHFPDRSDRVLNRLRDMRGGRLNLSEFGERMGGKGQYADYIEQMFALCRKRYGLDRKLAPLSTDAFRGAPGRQLHLF